MRGEIGDAGVRGNQMFEDKILAHINTVSEMDMLLAYEWEK